MQQERLLLKVSPLKLCCALKANNWVTAGIVNEIGDILYCKHNKRKDSNKWKVPAKVVGREDMQVLIEHSGYYIRVHPNSCVIILGLTNQKELQETLLWRTLGLVLNRKIQTKIWSTPVKMKINFIQLMK